MSRIVAQTLQNVPIEYEIATVGDRIAARMIDYAIWIFYALAWTWIDDALHLNLGSWSAAVVMLPIIFYDVTMETFMEGQTFGKMAMKIRVVNDDGSMPGMNNYILRWMFIWVELSPFPGFMGLAGLLVMAFNKKGQRLGDLAAGTCVIRLKFKTTFEDTIYRNLANDYEAMFPQVERLTDRDLAIINDILKIGETHPDDPAVHKVAQRVQQALNIQTKLQPYPFLHRILVDYNHVTGVEKEF